MSLQMAMAFVQRVRLEDDLRQKIAALGTDVTMDGLLQVAEAAGFEFSAEELQRAFRHDWAMRRAHYRAVEVMDEGRSLSQR